MAVNRYIKELLSKEEYSFSLDEVSQQNVRSAVSVKRELSRLVEKNEIVNLRRGFYLIIPPRYSKIGKVPIQLYADKLFKHLNSEYYLALYTAAKFHGAGHQQIQLDYIVTDKKSILDIEKKPVEIKFYSCSNWPKKNIIPRKSDAGYFNISSPALTAVDLIHYQTRLGGMNRMLAIIEELIEEIVDSDINNLLDWYPYTSSLQRLGFFIEYAGSKPKISQHIFDYLNKKTFFPVLLSPRQNEKAGAANNRWKIHINVELESDI